MRAEEFIKEDLWDYIKGNMASDIASGFAGTASQDSTADSPETATNKDSPAPSINKTQLKPLAQDAVTSGKVGKILNFIAQYESNGNYNIILGGSTKPLTKMTIAQVYALQDQMIKSGKESSAVGRYQFVKRTLQECVNGLRLDPNKTLFDEKTQDALIIYRLRSIRGLDQWLSGSLPTEKFLNNLSQEFASIPSPSKSGLSYHHGVGSNRAGTNLQTALSTLDTIQSA